MARPMTTMRKSAYPIVQAFLGPVYDSILAKRNFRPDTGMWLGLGIQE